MDANVISFYRDQVLTIERAVDAVGAQAQDVGLDLKGKRLKEAEWAGASQIGWRQRSR